MADQLGNPATDFTSTTYNETQVYDDGKVTLIMNIGWIPGCTAFASQAPDYPIDGNQDVQYQQLLKDAYYKCTGNNGLGGWHDVGCLRYGFYPTTINGVFAAPPDPEKYFEKMSYCG